MSARWETVRVFISSTFSDMHAERDHLVKVVFPSLREKLEKYRVHLVDIDLRWGVTKEQSDDDRALDLCLQQIDDCRPFFVGILGDRYGYIPQKIPNLEKPEYGWVQGMTGRSITDLEIVHGVLNDHQMQSQSFFYFRDKTFLDEVPRARRGDLLSDSDEAAGKQAELKQAIRNADVSVYENYPCRFSGLKINWRLARLKLNEDDQQKLEQVASAGIVNADEYANLDDDLRKFVDDESVVYLDGLRLFGQAVRDQLWEAIQAQLDLPDTPPTETLAETDPLAEEADYHERFMESRLRVYVGREPIQRALLKFADSDHTVPCLVTGPSGLGKSAAMAKFVTEYEQDHQDVLVIPHFIGASPASTGLRQMLHRFCSILKREFAFEEDIPPDTNSLSSLFRQLITQVPEDRRVLFVLDALNQLDETDNAHALNWLPRKLPSHVKLIASCIDDPDRDEAVLEAFRQRDKHKLKIEPLTDAERTAIVQQVPSLSAKTLDEEVQIGLLLANPATENPLFLLVALEELRGFGSFEYLDHRIAQFPRPHEDEPRWQRWLMDAREDAQRLKDEKKRLDRLTRLDAIESRLESTHPVDDPLTTVFLQVIDRLNDEFDTNVVREVLSLLASARSGLSRRELVDLVEGEDVEIGDSRGDLFPVLRQLRPYLQRRGKLIDFFHRGLFKAVREMYLSSDERRVAAHRQLADYFAEQPYYLDQPDPVDPAVKIRIPHERKVVELPWQRLEAAKLGGNDDPRFAYWDDVTDLLTDWQFLEAKNAAGNIFELAVDFRSAWQAIPHGHDWRQNLRLMDQALRRHIHWVHRHRKDYPQGLLQCLYNEIQWCDSLEAQDHYDDPEDVDYDDRPPIRRTPKLHELLARWRDARPAKPWVRDVRPPKHLVGGAELTCLRGHQTSVIGAAFDSTGGRIVSGSSDGNIRVWDADTGAELGRVGVQGNPADGMAISREGDRIVFGSEPDVLNHSGREVSSNTGNTVRVWDVANGFELTIFRGHAEEERVKSMAFSPDGTRVVSSSWGNTMVWDVTTGTELAHFAPHDPWGDAIFMSGVAFSRTGNRIVSGSLQGTVHIWDVATSAEIASIKRRPNRCQQCGIRSARRTHRLGSGRVRWLR
jgi:hypothetical protein